ncbi:MAG: GNAT family N-acetyltransferase [Actinomycetota bacterium]
MGGSREDFERTLRFMRSLDEIWCPRREPFAWGTAFFNDDFATQWDYNFLSVERPDGRLAVQSLAEEAERVQGAAGLGHRKVYIEDAALGARLRRGFQDLGWIADRLVVMAYREGGPRADASPAAEVEWSTVEPLRYRFARSASWGINERVIGENVRGGEWAGRVAGARYFTVIGEDEPVSVCDLYSDGKVAQVEDVGTLDEFTGRGYAKAVVQLALDEALEQGCDLVFLVADGEDWPKELYAKLGFEPVGCVYGFIRDDAHPKARS